MFSLVPCLPKFALTTGTYGLDEVPSSWETFSGPHMPALNIKAGVESDRVHILAYLCSRMANCKGALA